LYFLSESLTRTLKNYGQTCRKAATQSYRALAVLRKGSQLRKGESKPFFQNWVSGFERMEQRGRLDAAIKRHFLCLLFFQTQ